MGVFSKLKSLTQRIRVRADLCLVIGEGIFGQPAHRRFKQLENVGILQVYFEATKPSESSESLFTQPRDSLESIVEKAGEFTALDNEFLEELLNDIQPAQSVNQLISHIVLEVAHGSATNNKSLGDTAKLRISNKIEEFDEGKFVHFVLAMLGKNAERSETITG